MTNKHDTTGFTAQVLAGALAAVTAALLGSTLGVAGTVLGAGIASVVTTIAATVYLRSIQTTRVRVKLVRAKATGRTATEPDDDAGDAGPRPARWPALITAGVLAFVLGMLVITGVEWITGDRVSGGSGTTIGDIVRPRSGPNPVNDTPAPSAPTVTSTTTAPSTGQPTTSAAPTSGSTTSPPATTTTPTSTSAASASSVGR